MSQATVRAQVRLIDTTDIHEMIGLITSLTCEAKVERVKNI
jgi:hypothetical protein